MITTSTIVRRKKPHNIVNGATITLCGISATTKEILHTYQGTFTMERSAICKTCYKLGLEMLEAK